MPSRITITDDRLYNQITEYCKINGLKISDFCTKLLREGLAVEQYGNTPFGTLNRNVSESMETIVPEVEEVVVDVVVPTAISAITQEFIVEKDGTVENIEPDKEVEKIIRPKKRRL